MTDTPLTDSTETGDIASGLLAFAFTTAVVVGATLLGCFTLNELLRRKEQREMER